MIDNISWLAIYPEIVLLTMACVIALVDLGVHSPRRTSTYVLTMLTLAVVAATCCTLVNVVGLLPDPW